MWNKLSMKDRANYIRLAVKNNIKDLGTIRNIYNQYATGGYKDDRGEKQVIINPNDKFLYHRDFADVYQDSQGRRYSVYTEDDSLPTVTSNMSRKNLEKPLWENIQKQYARNPQGMKTIEDAVTWGGNVAGASALAIGTAPIWLPYAATAANTLGKVGKQTLQGLDWLFNPTTYRGALLSSYVGAEGVDEFRKNPNIETGAQAALGLLPVIPAAINGARSAYSGVRSAYNTIEQNLSSLPNTLYRDVYRPLTFPIRNTYRRYVTRPKKSFDPYNVFYDRRTDNPSYDLNTLKFDYLRAQNNPLQVEDQFGNELIYMRNIPSKASFKVAERKLKQPTPEIRSQVSDYKQKFQNLIGEEGVVAGSTRSISSGYINGTLNNDTEIITTKSRFEALKKKLNFQFNRKNSVGGYSGTSPFAQGKTNEVEFDFIEESPEGFAKGTLAHSIYSILHPEKRASIVNKILTKDKFNQIKTDDIELPISAEELYQQFQKAPEETKDLVSLVDMLGAGINTVNEANAMKHGERAWNVLLNQEHTSQVSKAIDILGKKWFGAAYKIPSKEYPNLKFNDVEANKEFINSIINIVDKKVPEEHIERIANNPKQMENLFNYWYQNNLVTHRQSALPGKEFTPQQTWDALFNQTHSVGGGAASGVGRNNTSGKMIAFPYKRENMVEGTTQALITFYPEKIKNLKQFTKKFQEISDPNIVNDFSIYKENYRDAVWTPEQEAEVLQHIHSLDRPVVRSMTTEHGVGAYNGSYVGSNYPQDFDPILGQRPSVVSYMQSPEFGFAFSPQFPASQYHNLRILSPLDFNINSLKVQPELLDRIDQIVKTVVSINPMGLYTYKPKQITNLKKIGFNVASVRRNSQNEIIKKTQKYINRFLSPNERLSLKDTKYFLRLKNNLKNKSYQDNLFKKIDQNRVTLDKQISKYRALRYKQRNFKDKIKTGLVLSGVGSLPTGIGTKIITSNIQLNNKTEDLVNSVIYDQLSQESQKKTSKEVVYSLVRDMVHSEREFDEEYKEETIQEILKNLQKYGIKLKETSKYNTNNKTK